MQTLVVTIRPRLRKEIAVAVAIKDQAGAFRRPADYRIHQHQRAGEAVSATDSQSGAIRNRIDACDRVLTGGQRDVSDVELERNIRDPLIVIARLSFRRQSSANGG